MKTVIIVIIWNFKFVFLCDAAATVQSSHLLMNVTPEVKPLLKSQSNFFFCREYPFVFIKLKENEIYSGFRQDKINFFYVFYLDIFRSTDHHHAIFM